MIGLIGNGSWATAIAKILTDNGQTVKWWMRSEHSVMHIKEHAHNEHYLTAVQFQPSVIFPTTDLSELVASCETIIICIPSAYVDEVLKTLPKDAFQGKQIVSAIKGILPHSFKLLQDYLVDNFQFDLNNYYAITGPCHAEEVAQERLSYLTFSGYHAEKVAKIASIFRTKYIRTTTNCDLWGVQYAAVLKNIYALGAGIAHGIGYGDNFLSVYITNCYREMNIFLHKHFQQKMCDLPTPDFHTSAYLGDLLVTSYSPHSRNRSFGSFIGKGYSIQATMAEMNMVAEGYYAAQGIHEIMKNLQFELPIAEMIYKILWQDADRKEIFKQVEDLLS